MGDNIYFMKFEIIINKWANFYFFLQNLSLWHFSNVEDYNRMWEKEIGQFSLKEIRALEEFKMIHLKYPFGKKYLGRPFFLKKNQWKSVKQLVLSQESSRLKEIFSLFQNKFAIIYKKDLPLFKKWQKNLQNINTFPVVNRINNILSTCYNVPPLKGKVKIYLLFSSPIEWGGGANLNSNSITLEICRCRFEKEKLPFVLGAIWHELIHAYFEKAYFSHLLSKVFSRNQKKISLTNEVVCQAVSYPYGFLTKKVLNISISRKKLTKGKAQMFSVLRKIVGKYLKQKKPLDREFIEEALFLINKFKIKGV